jgi:hypothetical protein
MIRIADPETKIFANTEGYDLNPGEAGDGGTIRIETEKLFLSGEGNISSDTKDGGGTGGNIMISGPGGEPAASVEVSNGGRILSGSYIAYLEGGSVGDGGTVEINAENISFTDGGWIGSESDGPGKGGRVVIRGESVRFSGTGEDGAMSKAYTSSLNTEENAGDAGEILIEADHLVFENSGGVTASTLGPGNAGIINITADQVGLRSGASISSASEAEGEGGDAGTIYILADDISLNDNSSVTTETAGEGKAGDITLKASNVRLDDNSFVTSASTSASGDAGDAGMILLDLTGSVIVKNGGAVTTEAREGGGGKIFIGAGEQIYLLNGEITSSVRQGWGDGGDIITDSAHVVLNQSPVTANAFEGDGGAIFIVTENFLKSQESKVTAASERGNDGTVKIEAPDNDVSSDLAILPETYIDATQWMKRPCAARSGETVSRFVIKGRDATPRTPDDLQPGKRLWFDE